MRIFYSPARQCFLNDTWFALEDMPSDAVEITAEEHRALVSGQSEGNTIVTGAYGKPTLVKKVAHPEGWDAAHYRAEASARLVATDWTQAADTANALANYDEYVAYRAEVRRIRTLGSYEEFTWPEMPTPVWKDEAAQGSKE